MSTLKVTNCIVTPVKEIRGRLRAWVKIVLNDELQLCAMRLYAGVNGMFLAYPNEPDREDATDYRQCFYPITGELRNQMESAALDEYADEMDRLAFKKNLEEMAVRHAAERKEFQSNMDS